MQGRSPQPALAFHRADLVQALVANIYSVPLEDMRARTRRQPRAALARQVAMYLSHIAFGMRPVQVAEAFGRKPSTTRYALHRIEELREDPELDRTLGYLETLLRGSVGLPS